MKWVTNTSKEEAEKYKSQGYVIGEPKAWALEKWEWFRMTNKSLPLFPPTVEKLKKDGMVGIYEKGDGEDV